MGVRLNRAELDAKERAYAAGLVLNAKPAPEPRFVNIDAVLEYGAPRRFVEGGIGFRAPPLSYPAGVRLFVAANALRDILAAGDRCPPQFLEATRDTAIRLIGRALHPLNPFRRLRGGWLRVFHLMETARLEMFLRFLLFVPDNSKAPPEPTKVVTIDLMGSLADFVREWPAWTVRPFRWRFWQPPAPAIPVSWAAYKYGMRNLGRAWAREKIRIGESFRAAQGADKSGWQQWLAEETAAAGW